VNAGAGGEALKLGFYFGEHDRHRGRFLSEAILDLFERRRLAVGILLRGAEGFGARQRLQTDRLLSLSEDLPLVAIAVDRSERIHPVAAEVAEIAGEGLLTLERARLAGSDRQVVDEPHEEVKLTIYTGRRARRRGVPAHVGVVATLHRHAVAGATALIGVDGTVAGRRFRGRFFSANSWVPTMVVAVGERERIAAALTELESEDDPPLATLERVQVCRRDGLELGRPAGNASDSGPWTKLAVYCSERSEHRGHSLYMELVRRLRAEGGAGATALRGVWGYHGEHTPHGDRLLALRRHVPIVVTVIDIPSRSEHWFEIAAELTEETGLVTVEAVPNVLTLE
jgi:PII-like signaling protein